jgi:hypothetical protein
MTTTRFIDYTFNILQEYFMSKSSFDRIMDWPYHPQMIIAIAFVGFFVASMHGDGPAWAAVIASAIVAPFAALLLFLPYLIIIVVLAALFSLLQAIS